MKSFLRAAILVVLCVSLAGCSKKEESRTLYTAIPEDYETIDHVNENSDYKFKLLEEMNDPYVIADVGSLYGEDYIDDDYYINSYGIYVSDKDAILRTQISIGKSQKGHILGVQKGDTYKEAKSRFEDAGFTCKSESPFNSNTFRIVYSKGIVNISILTDKNDTDSTEDDVINSLGVNVTVDKENK